MDCTRCAKAMPPTPNIPITPPVARRATSCLRCFIAGTGRRRVVRRVVVLGVRVPGVGACVFAAEADHQAKGSMAIASTPSGTSLGTDCDLDVSPAATWLVTASGIDDRFPLETISSSNQLTVGGKLLGEHVYELFLISLPSTACRRLTSSSSICIADLLSKCSAKTGKTIQCLLSTKRARQEIRFTGCPHRSNRANMNKCSYFFKGSIHNRRASCQCFVGLFCFLCIALAAR